MGHGGAPGAGLQGPGGTHGWGGRARGTPRGGLGGKPLRTSLPGAPHCGGPPGADHHNQRRVGKEPLSTVETKAWDRQACHCPCPGHGSRPRRCAVGLAQVMASLGLRPQDTAGAVGGDGCAGCGRSVHGSQSRGPRGNSRGAAFSLHMRMTTGLSCSFCANLQNPA